MKPDLPRANEALLRSSEPLLRDYEAANVPRGSSNQPKKTSLRCHASAAGSGRAAWSVGSDNTRPASP